MPKEMQREEVIVSSETEAYQHTEIKNSEESLRKEKKKHLIFSLEGKRYGIPLSLIKEVIGMCNITPIPRVPAFYKGMINIRGQIISVIDLRVKLSLKEAPVEAKKTSIIISHVGDILVGTIVDEVLDVTGYHCEQIDYNEAERMARTGDGVYGVAKESEGDLTLLIDIEKALGNSDFKVIKEKAA